MSHVNVGGALHPGAMAGDACSTSLLQAIAGFTWEIRDVMKGNSRMLIQGSRKCFMAECLALVDDSEEVHMGCVAAIYNLCS